MGFLKLGTPEKIEVIAKEKLAAVLQKFGVAKSDDEVEKDDPGVTEIPE